MRHETYVNSLNLVINASCPPNSLVLLPDKFSMVERPMTTVYAITVPEKTTDVPSEKLWWDGQGAA